MSEGFSTRTWIFLGVLLVVVAVFAFVGRAFRRHEDRACPRPYPTTELAVLLAADQPGWPPDVPRPRPEDLRPLEDPADSETCARLRALLPDTLVVGTLAAQSVAFYHVGSIYVVPVVPNLKPAEIEAMERGEFQGERRGATFLFDAGYQPLGVLEN